MLDFEKEFQDFVNTGNQGSVVTEIYKIIPTLSEEKIKILMMLRYFCKKYDLDRLNSLLDEIVEVNRKNKNLNFISSMNVKNLLKAYTIDELVRGVKVNSQIQEQK